MLRGAVGLVEKLTCRYFQKSTSLQLLLLTLYWFISLQECVAVLSGNVVLKSSSPREEGMLRFADILGSDDKLI